MLMENQDSQICQMDDYTRQIIEKGKKKSKANFEKTKQEVLKAGKNPPFNKNKFRFSVFANTYERPDIIELREPIHNISQKAKINYAHTFYFDQVYRECKDENQFARLLEQNDEVR